MSNKDRDSSHQLRKHLDSDDPFMSAGHQILVERQQERVCPEWAKSDTKIQEILLRSFPKLKQAGSQDEKRAGRWARVIQLYFRMNCTHGQIAKEFDLPYRRVENLICAIKRAAQGRSANGSGLYRKRGRPRKS